MEIVPTFVSGHQKEREREIGSSTYSLLIIRKWSQIFID